MKAHIGVGEAIGLVHSVVTTAANLGDVTQVSGLLHDWEKLVFSNARTRRALLYERQRGWLSRDH